MDVLVIIFIIFALMISLFSATLVGREVVIEEKERRKKKKATSGAAAVTEQPPASDEAEAPDEEAENGAVMFSAETQSLDEKYSELSLEYKGYYDEIVRSATELEGSKQYKNAAYEEYRMGKSRFVRLKIKRGVIICELFIPNLAFKSYISDNKVSVKQAPAIIRVVDEAALNAAKDSIGIAVKAIEEERAYKKEQAKLRRSQNETTEKETTHADAE